MIVGLTGGIGSGKSTVAKLLELLGCAVFNSDEVAKQVYFEATIKQQVITLLGEKAYLDENKLNKSFISSQIFSNTELLKQLNSIIHPKVANTFKDFISQHAAKLIIKESALLFETKLNKELDKIIVVTADEQTRINRVIKRDGLNADQILQKIKSQLSESEKIKMADYVVRNNETELILPQVLNIHAQLLTHMKLHV